MNKSLYMHKNTGISIIMCGILFASFHGCISSNIFPHRYLSSDVIHSHLWMRMYVLHFSRYICLYVIMYDFLKILLKYCDYCP